MGELIDPLSFCILVAKAKASQGIDLFLWLPLLLLLCFASDIKIKEVVRDDKSRYIKHEL